MDAETSERISAETRRLMNLRLDNQLRYLRVKLCDDEETRSGTLSEIWDIFAPDIIQGEDIVRFFVEGDKLDYINEIREIPGVEKATIF
jgi:hypothetical protein